MKNDANNFDTMRYSRGREKSKVSEVLSSVYVALEQKGYDPVNQIVGYLISGDPTYVTSFNDARFKISKLERDELLEELVSFYLAHHAGAEETGE